MVTHSNTQELPPIDEPDKHHKPSRATQRWKETYEAATVASVGIEMGLAVVVGWFIGYTLDNWLGTAPYLMLLWLGFGVAAGFRGLWRVAKRAQKKDEANGDSGESNP